MDVHTQCQSSSYCIGGDETREQQDAGKALFSSKNISNFGTVAFCFYLTDIIQS
jgi:hypothetical protein